MVARLIFYLGMRDVALRLSEGHRVAVNSFFE